MNTYHHTTPNGDLYEFVLRGHVISRITRYSTSGQYRKDLTYIDCPLEVQNEILKRVSQNYDSNN